MISFIKYLNGFVGRGSDPRNLDKGLLNRMIRIAAQSLASIMGLEVQSGPFPILDMEWKLLQEIAKSNQRKSANTPLAVVLKATVDPNNAFDLWSSGNRAQLDILKADYYIYMQTVSDGNCLGRYLKQIAELTRVDIKVVLIWAHGELRWTH